MKRNQRKAVNEKIAKMKKPKDGGFLEMLAPEHVKRARPAPRPRLSAEEKAQRKTELDKMSEEMKRVANLMAQQMSAHIFSSPFPGSYYSLTRVESTPKIPVAPEKLAELQASAPRMIPAPEKPMPDYVSAITGWRAWSVAAKPEGLRLKSLGQDDLWEPRQPKNAQCKASQIGFFVSSRYFFPEAAVPHAAPEFNCSCGIWAFKDLPTLVAALSSYADVTVIGQVSLWGKVVETTNGWRAETAYPAELWLPSPRLHSVGQEGWDTVNLEDLSWIYNVPIRTLSE